MFNTPATRLMAAQAAAAAAAQPAAEPVMPIVLQPEGQTQAVIEPSSSDLSASDHAPLDLASFGAIQPEAVSPQMSADAEPAGDSQLQDRSRSMSILSTIETDLAKVPALFKTALADVGAEAKTVLSSVVTSASAQALALAKETPVGTAIVNSLSAVQASGGNLAAAEGTIIANAATAITALDKTGSVLTGLEAEVAAFATSLVAAVIADFTGNAAIAPIIGLLAPLV